MSIANLHTDVNVDSILDISWNVGDVLTSGDIKFYKLGRRVYLRLGVVSETCANNANNFAFTIGAPIPLELRPLADLSFSHAIRIAGGSYTHTSVIINAGGNIEVEANISRAALMPQAGIVFEWTEPLSVSYLI